MSIPPGVCFVCRRDLDEEPVVIVKQRGIRALIDASVKRGLTENQTFLHHLYEVTIHDSCRKRYTVVSNVEAAVRRGGDSIPQTTASTRASSCMRSKLQNICLLCGEDINEDFVKLQQKLPLSRRNMVHKVEKLGVRKTVLDAAQRRGDEWGKEIELRLSANKDDLVAAKARYHSLCYKNLFSLPGTSGQKRGYRPADDVEVAMDCIFKHIFENSEECQFSLDNLLKLIKGNYIPDLRTVKSRLKKRFGDDIVISEPGSNRGSIICFKDSGHKILYDHWYEARHSDIQQERLRVVKTAAEIILEDIRSQVYDTSEYPPPDDFFNNLESVIPESLQLFYETIVLKNKRGTLETWKRKCVAFSHALISAVRPRSFVSSLLTGVGTYFYRKFGSKHLVNICSALGFSCSYTDAVQLESSAILRVESSPLIEKGAFVQFVFDNADVNVNTLNGENTFHEMGGIMCVSPHTAVHQDNNIPRLNTYVTADNVSSHSEIQIKHCNVKKNSGLSSITINDLQETFELESEILPSAPDLLWLYGKSSKAESFPGWNGFMEQVTEGLNFSRSKIIFLPFIHAPPTDYDTVFTSLNEAAWRSKAYSQRFSFVTFDQPLFIKARDIVESGQHPDLSCTIVRLGGFHLLMSFMGCIGVIMEGSGLKELLTTIYADNSVEKILNGHAYSRAVRAHTLTNLTLAGIILDEVDMTTEERNGIESLLRDSEKSVIMSAEDIDAYQVLKGKFKSALKKIEANGPTSQLWIQYFRMTTLIKLFIQAERAGDWNLHLYCIHKMLPFFHSAGHYLYAKSAHLYLQDMIALEQRMDKSEYDIFTNNFTIRRSGKFWSGLWSDLTIEQKLMRSMKSHGGLTQGRGISNSVLARWTMGMGFMVNICEELESFCRISCPTGEQHVDMRPSRIIRDNHDVGKLKSWFELHPPFTTTDKLISISSGLVGGPDINCHMAQQLGTEGVKLIVGKTFDKVAIKRKNKVATLALTTRSVKLRNKNVVIDPLTIFQRVCITKQSEKDLQEYFQYELAPFPLSLFTEQGMRKGTKSSLYYAFTPLSSHTPIDANTYVVVDGGYLLHKVVWQRKSSVVSVISGYTTYVNYHFGRNVSIVFDGYPEDASNRSTKTAERLRRYDAYSTYELTFDESTIIQLPQDKVLANEKNKRRLITLLCDAFEYQGVEATVAQEDADREIVLKALSKSSSSDRVVIVGEDVDLLVLLNALGAEMTNVYLQKSSKNEAGCCHYSTTSYNHLHAEISPQSVLFTHAFTGSDTTSAPFGHGKTKFTNLLGKSKELANLAEVFLQQDSTKEAVRLAGIKLFVALYGGNIQTETLNSLRYKSFVSSNNISLARLPPSEDAAGLHAFRCYHQVQKWLGADKNPTDWGWKLDYQGLTPVTSTMDPAPDMLLRKISCKCKKGCSGRCSCRKAGLKCSVLCQACGGKSCSNTPTLELDASDDEDKNLTAEFASVDPANIGNEAAPPPFKAVDCSEPGPSKIRKM